MDYFAQFAEFLEANATNPGHTQSEQYTGSSHQIYGIRAPILKAFVKDWLREHRAALDMASFLQLLDSLMATDILETRALAGYVMGNHAALRTELPLDKLATWLLACEGWAEVDALVQSSFTYKEMATRWDEWVTLLRALAVSENISQRRASLVLLVGAVRNAPDRHYVELALENVEKLKHERHKLITKAISWVMREALKQHPDIIRDYLAANADSLPAVAVRETRQKLAQ